MMMTTTMLLRMRMTRIPKLLVRQRMEAVMAEETK